MTPIAARHSTVSEQIQNVSNSRPFLNHKILDVLIRVFLCALSGAFLCIGCLRPGLWFFSWFGFLPLLIALFDRNGLPSTKHPFAYGFFMGTIAIAAGFSWILPFLSRFGELSIFLAIPIFLLFSIYHGLVFALFAWLVCYLRRELDLSITCIVGISWVSCEFIFPCIFPWYLALTQARVPIIIQIADFTGPIGVSFLLAISSGVLFDAGCAWMRTKKLFPLPFSVWGGILLILFSLIYGGVRIYQIDQARAQAPKIKLGLVQPNIGIDIKGISNQEEQFKKLHDTSKILESQGADLIVWPESAFPYLILRKSIAVSVPGNPTPLHAWHMDKDFHTPLLFGALTEGANGYYNSALMMNREGNITGIFDKNFLLIFGEYIPFWEHVQWLKKWVPNVSNTNQGISTTTFPFDYQGKQYFLGPMICYEDIIPAFGRRLFDTSKPPHLLINITNDAWFGKTEEPYEHLGLAIFRAIEHRVDLVRVTNTGVSAYIDAVGRVYDETPSFDPEGPFVPPVYRLQSVALMTSSGLYQKWGDAFSIICLAIVLLLSILVRHRAGKPIRFLVLFGSVAFLNLIVFTISLLAPGVPFFASYATLLHQHESRFPEAQIFQATWLLLVGLSLGSFILGSALEFMNQHRLRKGSSHPVHSDVRLEIVAALMSVTILPVFLLGTMEGNTGAVVIMTLVCVLCALLGETIVLRVSRRK